MATDDRGLGSKNMPESKKRKIQSAGGKVSPRNFKNLDEQEHKEISEKGGVS